jgi:hypothetical protein
MYGKVKRSNGNYSALMQNRFLNKPVASCYASGMVKKRVRKKPDGKFLKSVY